MYAHRFAATMVIATAVIVSGLATIPSGAQTPDPQTSAAPTTLKKKPAQVAAVARPPARVTVRKRSFLDPGTETKPGSERYMDYAFPPSSSSHLPGPGDSRVDFTRMPFPSCFDLGGFCR